MGELKYHEKNNCGLCIDCKYGEVIEQTNPYVKCTEPDSRVDVHFVADNFGCNKYEKKEIK